MMCYNTVEIKISLSDRAYLSCFRLPKQIILNRDFSLSFAFVRRHFSAEPYDVTPLSQLLKWNISVHVLYYSSAGINVGVQSQGSLRDCISAKLTCSWRLMNKFVHGSPLYTASPLSLVWFMDTQQCMSYNFKRVCFSSRRWNFKCCDKWPLVDSIYYSVVI